MVPTAARAIEQIRTDFPDLPISIREDDEGGAYVILEAVPLGPPYMHAATWMGFRIVHQYPYADTYPHYVRGDLARLDGRPLGDGMSPTSWEGRPAVQLSRRSNRLDAATDTAALKLKKVLAWLLSRP